MSTMCGSSDKNILQINPKIVYGIGKSKLSGISVKTILQINQKIVSEIEIRISGSTGKKKFYRLTKKLWTKLRRLN